MGFIFNRKKKTDDGASAQVLDSKEGDGATNESAVVNKPFEDDGAGSEVVDPEVDKIREEQRASLVEESVENGIKALEGVDVTLPRVEESHINNVGEIDDVGLPMGLIQKFFEGKPRAVTGEKVLVVLGAKEREAERLSMMLGADSKVVVLRRKGNPKTKNLPVGAEEGGEKKGRRVIKYERGRLGAEMKMVYLNGGNIDLVLLDRKKAEENQGEGELTKEKFEKYLRNAKKSLGKKALILVFGEMWEDDGLSGEKLRELHLTRGAKQFNGEANGKAWSVYVYDNLEQEGQERAENGERR